MINKKVMIILPLTFALIFSFFSSVFAQTVNRVPVVNLDGRFSDGTIGQLSILYPIKNKKDSIFYTDIRNRFSSDDIQEWNIGLGYRKKISTAKDYILGGYLFKDRREEYDRFWDMWTVGGELLTDKLDFRLNAYITENDKIAYSSVGRVYINDSQQLIYQLPHKVYYKSMNGIDFEIGKRFTEADSFLKDLGVYLKLYSFSASGIETMTGKQIRINKLLRDRGRANYKIGFTWQEDNIRGSDAEATFAVSIPFGKGGNLNSAASSSSKKENLERRMTELPRRDLDVVIGKEESGGEKVIARDINTGEEIGRAVYVADVPAGEGDGSKENPYSLADINDSDEVIVLMGEIRTDKGLELQENQKILSSNKKGFLKVSYDKEGSRSTIFKPDVEPAILIAVPGTTSGNPDALIYLNDNTTVSGIKFRGNVNHSAIYAKDNITGNIKIYENIVENQTGISIGDFGTGNLSSGNLYLYIADNDFNNNEDISSETPEYAIIIVNKETVNGMVDINIKDNNISRVNTGGISAGIAVKSSGSFSHSTVSIVGNKVLKTDTGYDSCGIALWNEHDDTQSNVSNIIEDNYIGESGKGIRVLGPSDPDPNIYDEESILKNNYFGEYFDDDSIKVEYIKWSN